MFNEIQIKRKVLQTAAPVVCILALTWIITACVSDEPGAAMKYLLTGPVSRINRFGNWIEQVITLIFTGLAVSIVFNATNSSMGAEGQIFVGAAAALVGLSLPALPGLLPYHWRLQRRGQRLCVGSHTRVS